MAKTFVTVVQRITTKFEVGIDNSETYVNVCGLLGELLNDYQERQDKSINEEDIDLKNHERLVGYNISLHTYAIDNE